MGKHTFWMNYLCFAIYRACALDRRLGLATLVVAWLGWPGLAGLARLARLGLPTLVGRARLACLGWLAGVADLAVTHLCIPSPLSPRPILLCYLACMWIF